jgi:hypothetical protein
VIVVFVCCVCCRSIIALLDNGHVPTTRIKLTYGDTLVVDTVEVSEGSCQWRVARMDEGMSEGQQSRLFSAQSLTL